MLATAKDGWLMSLWPLIYRCSTSTKVFKFFQHQRIPNEKKNHIFENSMTCQTCISVSALLSIFASVMKLSLTIGSIDWILTTVENCKWRNLCLIILEVVFPSIRSSVWKRSHWIEKSNQNTASSKPVAMLLLLINDPRDKDRLTLTDANGRPTQGCTWL